MKFYFTFDYFIQFLSLKTNVRPTEKHFYFICLFTLLYLFVLLLVVSRIFFIFIWQYSFFS